MKTQFLYQGISSSNLILFFSAFGSHPSHFRHLKSNKYDVLMCYSYENIDLNLQDLIKPYENVYLIGWSLGVFAAAKLLQDYVFLKNLAINGTTAVLEILQITPEFYKKAMNEFNLLNFKKSIFAERIEQTQEFAFKDESSLKQELSNLLKFAMTPPNLRFLWDKVLISKQDKFFPPKACAEFFRHQSTLMVTNEPHFVFFGFNSWDELARL
ncbi:DUF452 domain-containing protein [Campylobacter sp. MIT 99-7217]|nr:DUF452 domain-containing protein [Campylobacter sp. MIT 99-7217]